VRRAQRSRLVDSPRVSLPHPSLTGYPQSGWGRAEAFLAITLPRFRVETEVEGRVALVSLFGELDVRVADYCEARLSAVEVRLRHVVADLRGLTSIDRFGLHTLVRAHMCSRLGGWKLTLVRGPPSVDEAFTPRFIEELFDWIDGAEAVFPPPPPSAWQRRDLNDEEGAGE
jgi:anti-anti-sigma factor